MEQLCKCNNCNTVMFDENPSSQPKLEAPSGTVNMKKFEDTEEGDLERSFFWGCPECETDEYLQDVENIHDLK